MIDKALFEYCDRVTDGNLSSDGVQWSAEVDTTTAAIDVVVLSRLVDVGLLGTLLYLEFGLTASFRAVSTATADLLWKWQARNMGGVWVDLHASVLETDIGIVHKERTMSGYKFPVTNFTAIPFEVRLVLQCNELNGGRAKVKNSSYVRAVFKVSV